MGLSAGCYQTASGVRAGFTFLGNQYHLNVGSDDFYIDLLFLILISVAIWLLN